MTSKSVSAPSVPVRAQVYQRSCRSVGSVGAPRESCKTSPKCRRPFSRRGSRGFATRDVKTSKQLKNELHSELNITRKIPLSGVASIARVVRIGTEIDEVWVVESVQRFSPTLQ